MIEGKVKQMNASVDGYCYSISYSHYAYILSKKNRQYAKAYTYSIRVTKRWNRTEEIYEDVFDSHTMDLGTLQRQMQTKMSTTGVISSMMQ